MTLDNSPALYQPIISSVLYKLRQAKNLLGFTAIETTTCQPFFVLRGKLLFEETDEPKAESHHIYLNHQQNTEWH